MTTSNKSMGPTPEKPFWEAVYADSDAPAAFGAPAEEVMALVPALPPGSRVLDLGCGEGRNALYLAEQGLNVTALDVSEAGIRKLQRHAAARGLSIDARIQDLRSYVYSETFDLIVAHGFLHLLPPAQRDSVLERMQTQTRPSGYNVVVTFTDALPPPEDLAPFTTGLFHEGELFARYVGWDVLRAESYVLQDEHPGGIRHRHPINEIVARKPAAT